MKLVNKLFLGVMIILSTFLTTIKISYADCQVINAQCLDNQATKIINGISVQLSNACAAAGLTGSDCCWNLQEETVCTDEVDTCGSLRQNPNCALVNNTCIDKDYITGTCNKFQSTFSCAGGYVTVESTVCTNVVCSNNESGTASACFSPGSYESSNMDNMANATAYIQMGQDMAQDMNCSNPNDSTTCTLFTGKYFSCYLYAANIAQPGSYNNAGVDCLIDMHYFQGVPVGYAANDHNEYSQATSGTSSVMGSSTSYGLSNDNATAINNTVALNQDGGMPVTNQDENINYNPNGSSNSSMQVSNGDVVSVTINKDTVQNLSGFLSFEKYLSDTSVNLAWNRMKSEPDPNNIKYISFSELGITRNPPGNPFGWHSDQNYPMINGLCVHFGDYCEGGDEPATASDLIKGMFVAVGSYTNPNFCAACTSYMPFTNTCLTGEPRSVLQQWCCFSSKVAIDINLAAYDQGLLSIYTGGDKYTNQINHSATCGGISVETISKIDFSKGDYFKDFMDSIDVNQMTDTSNFTNTSVQNNTQDRTDDTALNTVSTYESN